MKLATGDGMSLATGGDGAEASHSARHILSARVNIGSKGGSSTDAAHHATDRTCLTHRQGPSRLHRLLRRVADGPHLRTGWRTKHMHWFWTLYGVVGKPPKVHTNDHAPTLEEAKAQLEAAWRQWLRWRSYVRTRRAHEKKEPRQERDGAKSSHTKQSRWRHTT